MARAKYKGSVFTRYVGGPLDGQTVRSPTGRPAYYVTEGLATIDSRAVDSAIRRLKQGDSRRRGGAKGMDLPATFYRRDGYECTTDTKTHIYKWFNTADRDTW